MKKMCIFLLTFCVSLTTAAQSQERATLLKGELTHGGFGGPEIRITELDGESNILIGGKGAWLIDRRFYLGGAGFGATKKIGHDELEFGYGGVMVGYIFPSQQMLTYSLELIAGAGGLNRNYRNGMHFDNDDESDTVLVFEPGIYMQFNLAPFANINAGLSYRLVSDSNYTSVSDSDLSGFSLNINAMFGTF